MVPVIWWQELLQNEGLTYSVTTTALPPAFRASSFRRLTTVNESHLIVDPKSVTLTTPNDSLLEGVVRGHP
jgi:hypothetical protein